jgi:AraC-like DNA-binding protein
MTHHELLLNNDTLTPLGRLRLAGTITEGQGVIPRTPLRVYGSYAVVCVVRGRGKYRDSSGFQAEVRTGDAILVFPERAHWYGPSGRQGWDEVYVTFDGPVFDLWRQTGLLDAARPVRSCPPGFAKRLRDLLMTAARPESMAARLRDLNAFLLLLSELLPPLDGDAGTPGSEWAAEAKAMLETDLGLEMDLSEVALAVGMSYETFRKRFLKVVGVTPTRYRTRRRIEAARELLRYSPQMTNRQVAATLGFADEFHFSRRFKEWTGQTPRDFREQAGA